MGIAPRPFRDLCRLRTWQDADATRVGKARTRPCVDPGAVGGCQDGTATEKIIVTNYERLHYFNPSDFAGIVLDESSILKNFTGKYRTQIIEAFQSTPWRLACTATPAPNDYMELGNHAEFLGVMSRTEMLSMFFVHDGGSTQSWRLKGHAESEFWKWLCSWAVNIRHPEDLGYSNDRFKLPSMKLHQIQVDTDATGEFLFAMEAQSLTERLAARRDTVEARASACAELVKEKGGTWLIWCNLNNEAAAIASMIPDAVNVQGSDKPEDKEARLLGFSAGEFAVLVTKPKIAGFGMNWQHCHNVAFVGLSDSWEAYYQCVRRCWRFGQDHDVNVYIITADIEGAVVRNIERKEADAQAMAQNMVEHMKDISSEEIKGTKRTSSAYVTESESGSSWTALLGDCVERTAELATDSIQYSLFSPPFASLYTYSNSDRDMGNCKDSDEFAVHFQFLVKELFRVTIPGRLCSFHCMNLPTSKSRDGYIGVHDFRGELIRAFQSEGWIYHSEVCIWKDPVTAMQRTKALGLLHKQIVKDSCMSRQGIPDYVVTMRKPGNNPEPVAGEFDYFCGEPSTFQHAGRLSIDVWQRYASPVWMDIRPSNTLQKESAREEKDERHICPLQLDVIERCLQLWTNPGDLVLSPFMGIGSEGFMSVKLDRRFIGIELKPSYWKQAVANLQAAEAEAAQETLFDLSEVSE
jgi:superfamily II DNA or RNA helicase